MRFCKFCGANLEAVRQALDSPEVIKKFDWNDTWLAEMFRSGQAAELRKRELERQMGITPAVKRYNEIKAGVITSSIGIGLAIFLFVFMQGLLGSVSPQAAQIISRLWVAGVIPFFVGVALMINGLVVSKRMVEIQEREEQQTKSLDGTTKEARSLGPADANEFIPADFSVTEQTTRHLAGSEEKQKS
ncbi:MAG TPA: hypothetical protein VGJ37_01205 [Pyrinomonadaceae bacterium]|jgi:hypothetical protein